RLTATATGPRTSRRRPPGGPRSVAVRAPVPGLAGQVVEAVAGGVGREPAEARVARADGAPAVAGEVDGQAHLVHRAAGTGRRRAALGRRHLVDGVVRRAAVGHAQLDLLLGVAIAAAAEHHAVGGGRV